MDRAFFEGVIAAAKKEQDALRLNHARQEGVISFCEIVLKKMDEEQPPK